METSCDNNERMCIICHEDGATCRYDGCTCKHPRYHLVCKMRSMAADVKNSCLFKCGACRSRINTVSYVQHRRCIEEIPQYHDTIQCVYDTLYMSRSPSKGLLTIYLIALFAIINHTSIRSVVSTRQQTSKIFNALKTLAVSFSQMIEDACQVAGINCIGKHGCSRKVSPQGSRRPCMRLLCSSIINQYDFKDVLQLGSMNRAIEMARSYDDILIILTMQCRLVAKKDAATNKCLLHFHV